MRRKNKENIEHYNFGNLIQKNLEQAKNKIVKLSENAKKEKIFKNIKIFKTKKYKEYQHEKSDISTCKNMATAGECDNNPEYMLSACAKACNKNSTEVDTNKMVTYNKDALNKVLNERPKLYFLTYNDSNDKFYLHNSTDVCSYYANNISNINNIYRGTCNVDACSKIINNYSDKGWYFDTALFGECVNCKKLKFPTKGPVEDENNKTESNQVENDIKNIKNPIFISNGGRSLAYLLYRILPKETNLNEYNIDIEKSKEYRKYNNDKNLHYEINIDVNGKLIKKYSGVSYIWGRFRNMLGTYVWNAYTTKTPKYELYFINYLKSGIQSKTFIYNSNEQPSDKHYEYDSLTNLSKGTYTMKHLLKHIECDGTECRRTGNHNKHFHGNKDYNIRMKEKKEKEDRIAEELRKKNLEEANERNRKNTEENQIDLDRKAKIDMENERKKAKQDRLDEINKTIKEENENKRKEEDNINKLMREAEMNYNEKKKKYNNKLNELETNIRKKI